MLVTSTLAAEPTEAEIAVWALFVLLAGHAAPGATFVVRLTEARRAVFVVDALHAEAKRAIAHREWAAAIVARVAALTARSAARTIRGAEAGDEAGWRRKRAALAIAHIGAAARTAARGLGGDGAARATGRRCAARTASERELARRTACAESEHEKRQKGAHSWPV